MSRFNNLLSIGLFILFTCFTSQAANIAEHLLATPINLTSGETTSLKENLGKQPVYLKFWATWCKPCRKEMPHFEEIQQAYGDDIKVIAINLGINDDLAAVNETIKEFGLTMPMAIDESGDLAQNFRFIGTPYHLVFDKQMNLVHRGHEANESLDNKLAILAQSDDNQNTDNALEQLAADTLVESEQDLEFNFNDGKTHVLYFSATWCDWYLKDSRPDVSKRCTQGQLAVNELAKQHSEFKWQGVISRLWTGERDLLDYQKRYKTSFPQVIDKSNQLFHQYGIKNIPALVVIEQGKVKQRFENLEAGDQLASLFSSLK